VSHSGVQGGWPGEAVLDEDPGLVDAAAGDVHLRFRSPCVDAGDNGAPGLPEDDLEGDPRVVNGDAGPAAIIDIGADELLPEIAARFGTTNAAGEALANVLWVNGSPGDARRRVVIPSDTALRIEMTAPPAGPSPAPFVLYAWFGEPDRFTLAVQPAGLGVMGRATPLHGNPADQPVVIWNNIGYRSKLGVPSHPSDPAPSVVHDRPWGLPHRVTFTLQGFLLDEGSSSSCRASISNAVVVEVR
jgi:hypothetical protein